MKHYFFLLVLTAFVLFVFCMAFAGCSTENPICSTNFCAIGSVFPRSELDDNTAFSEVAIDDAALLAAFANTTPAPPVATTPQPEPATDAVTLSDIFSDVENGGTAYLDQTITITGIVIWKSDQGDAIVISEDGSFHETVVFFITDFDDPTRFNQYAISETYTFTVEIIGIQASESNPERTNIWSQFPN